MRKHFLFTICALLALSVSVSNIGFAKVNVKPAAALADSTTAKLNSKNQAKRVLFVHYVDEVYNTAKLAQTGLDSAVFHKAVVGYYNLKIANKITGNNSMLTIVDFNKPSTTKRMWIVDLQNKKLVLNTWTAHGRGSGLDTADAFSNEDNSNESSLGFYVTNEVYNGKHGRSLRLDGMDDGFNNNARMRDIVLHGANYVSESNIEQQGYLGRSLGCPAVPPALVNSIIDTIKNKNVLFITGNDSSYTSKYLNEDNAAQFAFADSSFDLVKDAFTNN